MKILLYGPDSGKLEHEVEQAGLEVVSEDPDIVISYGGDGTFLKAEHDYPYIPKALIKNSRICKLCPHISDSKVFEKIASGSYEIKELDKLEVMSKEGSLVATSDVVIHNKDPRHGLRYELWLDDKKISDEEIIGDGIVVSTKLGSSGYYRSITDSIFETGIGLAFNNSTEQSDHMVLREDRVIKIKITRGPAVIYADNHRESFELGDGDTAEIKMHSKKAKMLYMI